MSTTSPPAEPLSSARVVALFRIHLRHRGYAEGTVRQRVGDIDRMMRTLGSLSELTYEDLVTYLSPTRRHWRPEYRKRITASV